MLAGPFANLSHTLIDLGDWSGAERACRRSISAAHEMFQRPTSPDVRLVAAQNLADKIPNAIGRLGARAKDRESLIAEFTASIAAARRLLNEHATLPADDKQAELMAMTQAYLASVERLQGHADEAVAWYHEAFQSLPKSEAFPRPMWIYWLYELFGEFRPKVATGTQSVCSWRRWNRAASASNAIPSMPAFSRIS